MTMDGDKIRCAECRFCNIEKQICMLKARRVTVDSIRKCKLGTRKKQGAENDNR